VKAGLAARMLLGTAILACHSPAEGSRASGPGDGLAGATPPPRVALCVTEGAASPVADALSIETPAFRAVAVARTDQAAVLRFAYLGPTARDVPLGSGQIRRQIGLKLRAADGCNVVYAMWRIEPASGVVVQVKRNPGQRSSAECGNRGYRTPTPERSAAASPVVTGSTHALRAAMEGAVLRVWADEILVWQGHLGDDVLTMDGPVGLRTDNGIFRVWFTAGTVASTAVQAPLRPCEHAPPEE
jgi:hypothetical protein